MVLLQRQEIRLKRTLKNDYDNRLRALNKWEHSPSANTARTSKTVHNTNNCNPFGRPERKPKNNLRLHLEMSN